MSDLSVLERIHFRDILREARYGALADAEGFQQMCVAVEALGKRLNPDAIGLGKCRGVLKSLLAKADLLSDQGEIYGTGRRFDALFTALKDARNDIAHTGAYARHVAADAVDLSLLFEGALMNMRITVQDFMVATPIAIQPWHSVGHARQLMLLNSFSYLPMWDGENWCLLSDMAVAKYLRPDWPAKSKISKTIEAARADGLMLTTVQPVDVQDLVTDLLKDSELPGLWVVVQKRFPSGHLAGVLSPFELM